MQRGETEALLRSLGAEQSQIIGVLAQVPATRVGFRPAPSFLGGTDKEGR